jgi:two-component system NtrC family sensor kinase
MDFIIEDFNILLEESIEGADRVARIVSDLRDLPTSRCQPGYLGQVFLNLLLNSLQAIESEDGEIKISSQVNDNNIIIHVSDNDFGIAEDELSRIFEPFYTSHDVGVGTGLGLTVCRDIIHSQDGYIKVQSEDPIKTPVRYKILFVDEEVNILNALVRIFRQENYQISTASNGK